MPSCCIVLSYVYDCRSIQGHNFVEASEGKSELSWGLPAALCVHDCIEVLCAPALCCMCILTIFLLTLLHCIEVCSWLYSWFVYFLVCVCCMCFQGCLISCCAEYSPPMRTGLFIQELYKLNTPRKAPQEHKWAQVKCFCVWLCEG